MDIRVKPTDISSEMHDIMHEKHVDTSGKPPHMHRILAWYEGTSNMQKQIRAPNMDGNPNFRNRNEWGDVPISQL